MLKAYTDGSCIKNPGGPGGWGVVILAKRIEEYSGSEASTTNNRMEMMGCIEALERTIGPLTIHTDSMLVIKCASGRWRKKKNRDLWERMENAMLGRRVVWQWVRGHNGDRWNERADFLAYTAAREAHRATPRFQAAMDRWAEPRLSVLLGESA